jgi:hypothetical protein
LEEHVASIFMVEEQAMQEPNLKQIAFFSSEDEVMSL